MIFFIPFDRNLNKTLKDINSVNNNSKFTMEIKNNYSLHILGVLIMHNSNTLSTRWSRKNNTLTFKHMNSCSPANNKIHLIFTIIRKFII